MLLYSFFLSVNGSIDTIKSLLLKTVQPIELIIENSGEVIAVATAIQALLGQPNS